MTNLTILDISGIYLDDYKQLLQLTNLTELIACDTDMNWMDTVSLPKLRHLLYRKYRKLYDVELITN